MVDKEKASIINEPLGKNSFLIPVPRVFRLLAELDKPGDGFCTVGLEKGKNFNLNSR